MTIQLTQLEEQVLKNLTYQIDHLNYNRVDLFLKNTNINTVMKKNKSAVIGRLVMKYRNPIQVKDAYFEYDSKTGVEKITLEEFKIEFNSIIDTVEKFTGRKLSLTH